MDKLAKKIKKEFARSPGKTVVLLLMCLVAGYYYVPILWKLFAGSPTTVAIEAAELPSAIAPLPIAITSDGQESKTTSASWSQVADWIRQDAFMKPTALLANSRNPFAQKYPAAPSPEDRESSVADKTVQSPIISPKQAGLVLWSTMVGASQRIAMINGRTYRENSRVVVRVDKDATEQESSDTDVVFRVARIGPTYVDLEHEGIRHRLELTRNRIDQQ